MPCDSLACSVPSGHSIGVDCGALDENDGFHAIKFQRWPGPGAEEAQEAKSAPGRQSRLDGKWTTASLRKPVDIVKTRYPEPAQASAIVAA